MVLTAGIFSSVNTPCVFPISIGVTGDSVFSFAMAFFDDNVVYVGAREEQTAGEDEAGSPGRTR